jgi:hypothetical protein
MECETIPSPCTIHLQNFVAVPRLSPGPVERHLALLHILRHFVTSHVAFCPVNRSRKIRYNGEDHVCNIFTPTGASVPWARDSDSCKCVLIGSRMHGRYSGTLVTYCFFVLVIASVSLFQSPYYRLPLCFPFYSPDMNIGVDVPPSSFPSLAERMSWS